MKILLLCSSSQNIYNFRLPLIRHLISHGHKVVCSAFDSKYSELLISESVEYISLENDNRSINPVKVFSLRKKYFNLIKKINPDIVFTFMAKPNIFGVMAAKKCGIKKIYSMVEGCGDPFYYNTFKWKCIRKAECILYKRAFKYSKIVFFLNDDDRKEFIDRKLVSSEKTDKIFGVGVDLEKFCYLPISANNCSFIMISRLLHTKGVFDFIKCAEIVKKTYPNSKFVLLGAEGTIKVSDIQKYIDNNIINYYGNVNDVRPYLRDSIALLLPSFYREGLPMSIMEAEATGRLIITTNNVGCKDTVVNGINGFLIDINDYNEMAKHCMFLIENFEKTIEMGKNARVFAENNFDQEKINEYILNRLELL